jgi:hypothetical protein
MQYIYNKTYRQRLDRKAVANMVAITSIFSAIIEDQVCKDVVNKDTVEARNYLEEIETNLWLSSEWIQDSFHLEVWNYII